MRCPDLVMSAVSYHPGHRTGQIAHAYWSFVAGYQKENGYLHRRRGQWYLIELASRFPFQSVRAILLKNIDWAIRRQQRDGGFQKDYSAESACQLVLAYSRHGMLEDILAKLRYDPRPLAESLESPLGLGTRREALVEREEDEDLAERQINSIVDRQLPDGSWEGLIVSTAQAIHDLLDCGLSHKDKRVRMGCSWLLAQQKPPRTELFPNTSPIDLPGMFYTTKMRQELDCFNQLYPEYATTRDKTCLTLLPILQTGAALAALCRSGLADHPGVERGFQDLFQIRGPGGRYYTDHWCACNTKRWIRTKKPKFDEVDPLQAVVIRPMVEGYIIDGCAHHRKNGLSYPGFRRFHLEVMKRYVNSAILAWSGDEVVGFANFYPAVVESPAAVCPHVDSELEGKLSDMVWPDDPGDTLSISCVNISEGFRRKGIGTKLVKQVVEWARENGYRRILAGANETQWWIPCRPFWEKLGFHVLDTKEFAEPREDGEVRIHTMELIL